MTIRRCSSVYRLLRSGCKNKDFCMFGSSTCGWEIMVLFYNLRASPRELGSNLLFLFLANKKSGLQQTSQRQCYSI